MSTVYPNLSKLIITYLSIITTSVPAEFLFSKTLNNNRNRLTYKRLHKLLFMQTLDDSIWKIN